MDARLLLLILLALAMVAMLFFAFAGPSPERARARRMTAIKGRHAASDLNQLEARMRKAIGSRKVEKHQLLTSIIPNPEQLARRLAMTGKKWTLSQYMATSAGLAILFFGLLSLRGFSLLPSLLVGLAAGFGLPHFFVGKLIARRVNKFTANFPDALDLLVRGLRSGLPVGETMNVVAQEIPGPVGEEFKLITERIKIGKSTDQSLQETAVRLGTPEFQFFCITLAIQRETGGNLAETLANLGSVLRQRAQMKLKIKAMSSESKASAYIIGSLPFLVFGLISWINFQYMTPFFTGDPNALFGLGLMQMVAIGGMGWMGIGVFIMAKMINFEI
ncbi:type II secretion system F family protein [Sphingobium nicotianae]|uniref:type II secretion system F family protein n=1 Tax=Sphingobium nicotianae TaxID=2782607 RepID=UPI003D7CC15A